MHKLIVSLPANREFEGRLTLEGENGRVLAGPFPVCGLADRATAGRHGNPSGHTLLPFGDTPLGRYRVADIHATGPKTSLPAEQFGPHGIIVLTPAAGDAALADANGRFCIVIQGGTLGPGRRLRPTNGALRLNDRDQRTLVRALRRSRRPCVCECIAAIHPVTERTVARRAQYESVDPPLLAAAMRFPIAAVGAGSSREDRFSFVEVHALRFAAPSFRLAGDTGGGGGTGGTGGGYSDPVVSGGIDQAESQEVERNAVTIAQDYDNRGVTYSSGGDASDGGSTSDCSHFVNDVLQQAGVDVPYTTTAGMANSPNFQEVEEADARPGDVIVQGNHMGIYTGTDPEGVVQGVQMGNHGAQTAPWGPGGWFSNAGDLRFYRPVPGKE